jgi:LytS/YehU family sensor histidine kinase
LKTQLHPHFLFNTLHSISTLMYRDVRAADRMLARLSDLLRLTLESSDAQEVPLRDEVAFLKMYLEIEQIRLGDRLTVAFEVDPMLEDVLVPNFVLQPLVENAVKHGIDPVREDGRVRVEAAVDAGTLRIAVTDNGRGPEPDGTDGIGLTNTRRRLAEVYGDDTWFALQPAEGGGAVAELRIPYRRSRGD